MNKITNKFSKLGVEFAPGQESSEGNSEIELIGNKLAGNFVDFSHGDVDAFPPLANTLDDFIAGVQAGAEQAYTEYKGDPSIRTKLAKKLTNFTGQKINPLSELIITPGTQGALFLALGSLISSGDKVAIVQPDYFANRKIVEFLDGQVVPIEMDFHKNTKQACLDMTQLEKAFKSGVKVFVFSNPNNPTGIIYSAEEITAIAKLASQYEVNVVVDELYARQIFDNRTYLHLSAEKQINKDRLITIIGPSKTESLSGYRLGVAFGSAKIIDRMEKLQAIVSLRASGYNQAILNSWFSEPEGWMAERIKQHEEIRDNLVSKFRSSKLFKVRSTEAGSYLFPEIPQLKIPINDFVKVLQEQANVIVTPGTEFGPQFTNSFRINFSQDPQAANKAVERIIEVTERYCK